MISKGSRRRSWLRTLIARTDGNVMLEFALVSPIICVMLIGMADLGRYGLQKSSLLHGAREGAQYGIMVQGDTANTNTTAQNATGLSGVTATSNYFYECTAGVSVPANTVCSGGTALKTYLTVTVTKAFSSIMSSGGVNFGALGGSWTAPTSLSATITMICP
jgi:Flp pilus assembly protein TadG